MSTADSYEETVEYLRYYASYDWLELSTVVVWANGVTGAGSTDVEVAEMTMRLATDLRAVGACPGVVVADDRDFVPWEGTAEDQLRRLRTELFAMVEQGRMPEGFDICWFHQVAG